LLAERRDRKVVPELRKLALESKDDTHSLRGLWGLYAVGAFDEALAGKCLGHKSPWVRSWAIRLLGEAGHFSDKMLERFTELAEKDEAPEVRLQLASTARRLARQETLPLLHILMKHREDARDPCLPLMIWLAYEPQVVAQRNAALSWLRDNAAGNPLVLNSMLPNSIRRLVDAGRRGDLAACVRFLRQAKDLAVRRQALRSMVTALQGKIRAAPDGWKGVLAGLEKDSDEEVRRLAQRLAVNFHDLAALRRALVLAKDIRKPVSQRIDAIRDVALVHPPEALMVLQALVSKDRAVEVRCEACRALAAYDNKDLPRALLAGWKSYPPELRIEVVNLLSGRKPWARELVTAVGKKEVARTDLHNNIILRILAFKDASLSKQIEQVWGRIRKTPAELTALIDKMRGNLGRGRASFERGRKVFEANCAKCHKFEGKGHEVGPQLDGAGRDIEYLLVNILDPNRVVGQPYYLRYVELKNGRTETGLLAAEDDTSITLKVENDVLKKFEKKDIAGKVQVLEKSVMPEGLDKGMTVQDFRDLVRYLMANPFLTQVAVAGPFTAKEATAIDVKKPRASKGVTWARPVVGLPGRIPLPAVKGKEPGSAFVTAEVTAPSGLRTKLQLGAGHGVRVWLNGKLVYKGQPGKGTAPDQASVDVQLNQGVNHLLFQVTYKGDREVLYGRLLDPNRKLKYPEPKEK
jgi:putative heme-binding domain-containing protein